MSVIAVIFDYIGAISREMDEEFGGVKDLVFDMQIIGIPID